MRIVLGWSRWLVLCLLTACTSPPRPGPATERALDLPGPRDGGAVRLPNQWWLRPVGRQLPLGDFPVHIAMHPRDPYAAVLHCGHGQHEVVTVDLRSSKIIARANLEEAFYGLAFSRNGQQLYIGGAGQERIFRFQFADGYLSSPSNIPLRKAAETGIAAGLALAGDDQRLFVANLMADSVSEVDLGAGKVIGEIHLGTNAATSAAVQITPPVSEDEAAITKRAQAAQRDNRANSPFPYTCVADDKRQRLYVSLWGQAAVAVIDLRTRGVTGRWPTQEHPNEMLLTRNCDRLFVANAHRNSVTVLDPETGRCLETLVAELQPNSPPGNTPNSLALSPDETKLFVANANINTVAVFDVSTPGRSRSLGFIPVGWYPTSVRVSQDGKRLLVANGKGIGSKSNRLGPQPGHEPPASLREYIGGLFHGTLSLIDLQPGARFEEQIKRYTLQSYRCMPTGGRTNAAGAAGEQAATGPIPLRIGEPSPIRYCIYIIKENRTYDQVLGDIKQGNGDPALCLFPEKVTPNHHKIAREFVLLDNFYVESEVSADGHEWSMGAYASDFVEKSWPLSYGHNQHNKYSYPAEGNYAIATPVGGYIWDRAREAGVSYRSYGEFVANAKTTNQPCSSKVASLKDHFDPWFWSFDMDYPDALRADRFISELRRFEKEGDMPRLQIVRLPNDHTSGTTAGKISPTSAVADNDLALGRVVEALSQSKFWPELAVFVVEDDAQNGPDHVDAHRTVAFVISPYVRRGSVDSTLYSTTSMLRTMELILGLKPMSQFDALATPMTACFQAKRDLRPYKALPANVDLHQRNTRVAWGSDLSEKMDFTKEDAADDLLLNEVVWRSVRGPDSPMPAPTRAAFVFPQSKKGTRE